MSDKDQIAHARLERATMLVKGLEAIVSKINGYSTAVEQALVREARAFLVESGKREPEARGAWEDRSHTCNPLADGTDGSRSTACELCHLQLRTRP